MYNTAYMIAGGSEGLALLEFVLCSLGSDLSFSVAVTEQQMYVCM